MRTKKSPPTKWFWEGHRLPRQLKLLEYGRPMTIPAFLEIVLEREIPNYWDLMRYYKVQQGSEGFD